MVKATIPGKTESCFSYQIFSFQLTGWVGTNTAAFFQRLQLCVFKLVSICNFWVGRVNKSSTCLKEGQTTSCVFNCQQGHMTSRQESRFVLHVRSWELIHSGLKESVFRCSYFRSRSPAGCAVLICSYCGIFPPLATCFDIVSIFHHKGSRTLQQY